jgi:hypothetical protein
MAEQKLPVDLTPDVALIMIREEWFSLFAGVLEPLLKTGPGFLSDKGLPPELKTKLQGKKRVRRFILGRVLARDGAGLFVEEEPWRNPDPVKVFIPWSYVMGIMWGGGLPGIVKALNSIRP